MEEMVWGIQRAMLDLLIEYPRSRRETVEETHAWVMESEYGDSFRGLTNQVLGLYTIFDGLRKDGWIVVTSAKRNEAIYYETSDHIREKFREWEAYKQL